MLASAVGIKINAGGKKFVSDPTGPGPVSGLKRAHGRVSRRDECTLTEEDEEEEKEEGPYESALLPLNSTRAILLHKCQITRLQQTPDLLESCPSPGSRRGIFFFALLFLLLFTPAAELPNHGDRYTHAT